MNILYETEGKLTESMAQSHICFEFYTEKELYGLKISFAYSVKASSDRVKNQLLFDECILNCYGEEIVHDNQDIVNEKREELNRISNMVTFSLEDENGFRGAAHRGGGLEAVINENEASPGFIKGVIPRGKLTATLSLHSLVAESGYQLCIYEMERA